MSLKCYKMIETLLSWIQSTYFTFLMKVKVGRKYYFAQHCEIHGKREDLFTYRRWLQ